MQPHLIGPRGQLACAVLALRAVATIEPTLPSTEVGMFCSHCGSFLTASDQFCTFCGTPTASVEDPDRTTILPLVAGADPAPPPHRRSRRRSLVLSAGVVAGVAAALLVGAMIVRHAESAKTARSNPYAQPTTATVAANTATTTTTVTATPSAMPIADFATLYRQVRTGVVRIETVSCGGQGVGTGFLLSPTLIATVNHVVDQSVVVSLIDGNQRTTGTVIGADPAHDLALVRAARPLTGYHFRLAATEPDVGSRVAAIGFPIGDPITMTQGTVSGLNRAITLNGVRLTGLIETDASINPGNSGGPLLTVDGSVIGLVDAKNTDAQGIAYAQSAAQATPRLSQWRNSTSAQPPAQCANPLGPPGEANPNIAAPTPGSVTASQAAGVVAALTTYFEGINSGNYAAAWATLSPSNQQTTTLQRFAAGTVSSYDSGLNVLGAHAVSPSTVVVALAFNSLQASAQGPDGDTCDDWTLDYTLIQAQDGSWLIDSAAPHAGSTHTPC